VHQLRYMRLRTSTHLIRTVLILISFQFLAPAFVWQPEFGTSHASQHVHVLSKHASQSNAIAALFEITERETEEEERDKLVAIEVVDNAIAYTERISASQEVQKQPIVSQHLQESPLFILNCAYLI
jgi:hypothetical protein